MLKQMFVLSSSTKLGPNVGDSWSKLSDSLEGLLYSSVYESFGHR